MSEANDGIKALTPLRRHIACVGIVNGVGTDCAA